MSNIREGKFGGNRKCRTMNRERKHWHRNTKRWWTRQSSANITRNTRGSWKPIPSIGNGGRINWKRTIDWCRIAIRTERCRTFCVGVIEPRWGLRPLHNEGFSCVCIMFCLLSKAKDQWNNGGSKPPPYECCGDCWCVLWWKVFAYFFLKKVGLRDEWGLG